MRSLILDIRSQCLKHSHDNPSVISWTANFMLDFQPVEKNSIEIRYKPDESFSPTVIDFDMPTGGNLFEHLKNVLDANLNPNLNDDQKIGIEFYRYNSGLLEIVKAHENCDPSKKNYYFTRLKSDRNILKSKNKQETNEIVRSVLQDNLPAYVAFKHPSETIKFTSSSDIFENYTRAFDDSKIIILNYGTDNFFFTNLNTGISEIILEKKIDDDFLGQPFEIENSNFIANEKKIECNLKNANNSLLISFYPSYFELHVDNTTNELSLKREKYYTDFATKKNPNNRRSQSFDFFILHNENLYCNSLKNKDFDKFENNIDTIRELKYDWYVSFCEQIRQMIQVHEKYNTGQIPLIVENCLQNTKKNFSEIYTISLQKLEKNTLCGSSSLIKQINKTDLFTVTDGIVTLNLKNIQTELQKYEEGLLSDQNKIDKSHVKFLCSSNQAQKYSKLIKIHPIIKKATVESVKMNDIFENVYEIEIDNRVFNDDVKTCPKYWLNFAMEVYDKFSSSVADIKDDFIEITSYDDEQFIRIKDRYFLNEKIRLANEFTEFTLHNNDVINIIPSWGIDKRYSNILSRSNAKFEKLKANDDKELVHIELNDEHFIFYFDDEENKILNSRLISFKKIDIIKKIKYREMEKKNAPYLVTMKEPKNFNVDNDNTQVYANFENEKIVLYPDKYNNDKWKNSHYIEKILINKMNASPISPTFKSSSKHKTEEEDYSEEDEGEYDMYIFSEGYYKPTEEEQTVRKISESGYEWFEFYNNIPIRTIDNFPHILQDYDVKLYKLSINANKKKVKSTPKLQKMKKIESTPKSQKIPNFKNPTTNTKILDDDVDGLL